MCIRDRLADVLEALDDFSLENQEAVVMKWIEDKGYHLGNIMNAFRLTLVEMCIRDRNKKFCPFFV